MSSKSHLTIALLSLLAAACAAPTGEANGGNDLRVTEADNGKTVSAAVGQDVLVSVTDYGDSGYTWSVVNAGGLGGGSQSHVGGSSQAGDFGTDVFTFTTSGLPAGELHDRAGRRADVGPDDGDPVLGDGEDWPVSRSGSRARRDGPRPG